MIHLLLATLLPCYFEEIPLVNPSAFFDALYKPIEDVTCDFEGRADSRMRDKPNYVVMKEMESYSGHFIYRNNGDLKHEAIHLQIPLPDQIRSEKYVIYKKLAIIDNKTYVYMGDAIEGGWKSKNSTFANLVDTGSTFKIFWVPYLKSLSEYPKTKVYHQSEVMVGEHKCEKISFTFGEDFDKLPVTNATFIESFYLDMNRGGHPVLVEAREKSGEISWRVVDIELQQFTDKNQRTCWLPVSGRYEALMESQLTSDYPKIKIGTVVQQEIYHILAGSVKLNTQPKNGDFILRFKNGKVIPDIEKLKVLTKGGKTGSNPVNLADAETRLEQLIKVGEEQESEIQATSELRGGTRTTFDWLTWLLPLFGVVGLGVTFYLVKTGRA